MKTHPILAISSNGNTYIKVKIMEINKNSLDITRLSSLDKILITEIIIKIIHGIEIQKIRANNFPIGFIIGIVSIKKLIILKKNSGILIS